MEIIIENWTEKFNFKYKISKLECLIEITVEWALV